MTDETDEQRPLEPAAPAPVVPPVPVAPAQAAAPPQAAVPPPASYGAGAVPPPPPGVPPYGGPPYGVRPPGGPDPRTMPEHPNSRAFGIAALVLCLIPIGLTMIVGVVLAIIVLARGRRAAGRGFGFAVGALAAAAVWVVVGVGALVTLGILDGAQRTDGSTGQVVEEGRMDPTLLQVTDCLDVPEEGAVTSVRAKPCSEPHTGEVYASISLTDGAYPGEQAVIAEAEQKCVAEFEGYVGKAYDDSELDMYYFYPLNRAQWDQLAVATCVVFTREPVTGTLRLANR